MSRRERLRDQSGTTVVELMMVCILLGFIVVMATQSLLRTSSTSAAAQERASVVADSRTILERLVRDVRAANPIETVANVSDYDTSVEFSIYCSNAGVGTCGSDHLRRVRWQVVSNRMERLEGGLTSTVLGPNGPSGLAANKQRSAVVNTTAQPVFSYYDAHGDLLVTTGVDALPPEQFRFCAKEIRVDLRVNAASAATNPPTVVLQTSATLRNYYEVDGC